VPAPPAAHDQLAAARSAVLGRLWGALGREPVPGIRSRRDAQGDLVLDVIGTDPTGHADTSGPSARSVTGPASAAQPFAVAPVGLSIGGHTDPAALVRALGLGPWGERLAVELTDSVANLALARSAQPGLDGRGPFLGRLPDLPAVEQSIVDGHPLHPLCRTRLGMSPAEVIAYAPEHRPTVELHVYEVPPNRWYSTGTGLPPLLLVHPWQRDHVLDRHPWLRPTGRTVPARPLASLRTLVPVGNPGRHVKTAVDVQMTSAVRIVSPAAVHNGPVLSEFVAGLAEPVGLHVLNEPAGGAVLVDGEPCRSLAMLHRQAPVPGSGEVVVPLAALSAPSPNDGRPLVAEAVDAGYRGDPLGFAGQLAQLLLPPLLGLLHAGVALEAHGQNTLVGLVGGRPTRLYYRDFGGVRLSPARLRAAGVAAPPLRGDLCCDDPGQLRAKLFAAVLATVVAELAATLERAFGTPPQAVWRLVADAARDTYAGLPAAADADAAALFGPDLPIKAMTAMRLADRPLDDLWIAVPNPLSGLR
jgi:siderophore synthetase component